MSAPRWLQRLGRPGARLAECGEGGWAVYPGGDRRRRALARIGGTAVRQAIADGRIEPEGEGRYRISEAGRAGLRRSGGEDGFARQHRVLEPRALIENGQASAAPANALESPLWRWRKAGAISAVECAAGERLREDHHRSSLQARLTRDPARSRIGEKSYSGPDAAPISALAASDRVRAALAAAGDGLDSLLLAVCIEEDAPEAAARARGWPKGAGLKLLGMGLSRLARHYGLTR
jgi:hypothetical protein